jgi:hypothetical protein
MARQPAHIPTLRAELASLKARYDSGAVHPAIFAIIKQIETDIAWRVHARQAHPLRASEDPRNRP